MQGNCYCYCYRQSQKMGNTQYQHIIAKRHKVAPSKTPISSHFRVTFQPVFSQKHSPTDRMKPCRNDEKNAISPHILAKNRSKICKFEKNRNFATLFGVSTSNAPTDRITDTNMQNEHYNTLILREKYPILSRCSSVSYSVLLQCNTSPAAHGQPRAGVFFNF